MTTTFRNADGAEVGTTARLKNALGVITVEGTPAVPSANAVSGVSNYRLNGGATPGEADFYSGYGTDGLDEDQSDPHIRTKAALRFADVTPASQHIFCEVEDAAGLIVATLRLEQTSGNVGVYEANGALATDGTVAAPFTADQSHEVELYIHHDAAGDWDLLIDGVSVANGVNEDFLITETDFQQINYLAGNAAGEDVRVDDFVLITDDSAKPATWGDASGTIQVLAYQQDKATQAADADLTPDDDTLDNGAIQWLVAGDAPIVEEAVGSAPGYIGTPLNGGVVFDAGANARGHAGGPSTDAPYPVTGTIRASVHVWDVRRGSGGGSTHTGFYGNGGDTPLQSFTFAALASNAWALRTVTSEAANVVPTASEDFAMGFGVVGARNIYCAEMFGILVHTPAGVDEAEFAALWPKGQQEPMRIPPEVVSYG